MTAKKKPSSKPDGKKSKGRPTSFKDEYLEQVRKMALLGLTDKEMATVLGIAESTFNKWKLDNPDFSESIKKGKELADANVATSLYERACGYSHEDVHFSSYEGLVTATRYTKHYPPDTAAAFIWLKNRQSAKWRDKTEATADNASVADALKQLADKLPD